MAGSKTCVNDSDADGAKSDRFGAWNASLYVALKVRLESRG